VVVIQQVEIARMRRMIDVHAIRNDHLSVIIRELQDYIDRHVIAQ
jgi:hypothetical protein